MSEPSPLGQPIRWLQDNPWTWLVLAGVLLAGLAAAWRLTPLGELADPKAIAESIEQLGQSPWAPLTIGLIYIVANVVVFPTLALNLAVILALGPWWGMGYALYGTLLAGLLVFAAGRVFGRAPLERLGIDAVDKPLRVIRKSGLPGLILLRMVPVAPYPIVNLLLGAGGIRSWVFLLGTAVGVLPSLLAMGVLGFQLREVFQDPTPTRIGILVAAVVVIGVLGWWAKQRIERELADA